jgi:hypothetical protein
MALTPTEGRALTDACNDLIKVANRLLEVVQKSIVQDPATIDPTRGQAHAAKAWDGVTDITCYCAFGAQAHREPLG